MVNIWPFQGRARGSIPRVGRGRDNPLVLVPEVSGKWRDNTPKQTVSHSIKRDKGRRGLNTL
jgi:hypothetical protein